MTLQELFNAVDELPWDVLEQLQERINQRRQRRESHPYRSQAEMMGDIHAILQDADPVALVPGTMDVDKLEAALAHMREGLTTDQLDEIVSAMNEEYIAPDSTTDG